MLIEMDSSFLRSLMQDFVEEGRTHGRSDEDIEALLRKRMRDHGVANQDVLIRLAFQRDQPSLPNERRVHLLRYGVALCGAGVPGSWPTGHPIQEKPKDQPFKSVAAAALDEPDRPYNLIQLRPKVPFG
jgi:hypothetical protein